MKPKDYLKRPYARILIPDELTGTFAAMILEFPGCVAQGNTVKESFVRLEKAAASWIQSCLDLGQTIPEPLAENRHSGRILLRLPQSVHKQAALIAQGDRVSLNQWLVSIISVAVGLNTPFAK